MISAMILKTVLFTPKIAFGGTHLDFVISHVAALEYQILEF